MIRVVPEARTPSATGSGTIPRMSTKLVLVRSRLSVPLWDRIDRGGHLIACTTESVRGCGRELLERFVERRAMLAVITEPDACQSTLLAGLISDLFALREGSSIEIPDQDPLGMAGLVWRLGRGAVPFVARHEGPLESDVLVAEGVVDVLVPEAIDPLQWFESWTGRRSVAAIVSAARLMRSRGGDGVERAEFARLFAAGVPIEGLRAFLDRRLSRFDEELTVEMI